MDAVDAVAGELAAAVGYQQCYYRCRPVGVEKYVRTFK